MLKIDLWYNDNISDISYIGNITFNDIDCNYRGHVFTEKGRLIGDFTCNDSVELEKRFPGCFGD